MSKTNENGMMQSNCPSLSPNAIYRLTTHCDLGLDCHEWVLCFYSKPSLVMHDGNVTLNPKFVDL